MPLIDSVTTAVRRMLGTTNEVTIRRLWPLVEQTRKLEAGLQTLDDVVLRTRSAELRKRVTGGATLDSVLPEALALAREAADRRLGMWNALDPARGFPDDAWGADKALVDDLRARLATAAKIRTAQVAAQMAAIEARSKNLPPPAPYQPPGPIEEAWDLDLPASFYATVRRLYPESLPPFRMRAHDVQILGAIVLHNGRIAEMRTGEGKTLVASLTCYHNSLAGKGLHVITVNDYLAARDAAWNAPTLRFLGTTIGAIQSQMPSWVRKEIYQRDVVYGTNHEFGFDYLRDNLARSIEEQVQTRRNFAIVDEVDSVLIDEARTPLIISGPASGRMKIYEKAAEVAAQLVQDSDFEFDVKDRHVTLTESGQDRAAQLFGFASLWDSESMHIPHYLDNALKARCLYIRDKQYMIVADPQNKRDVVKIIDENTGRPMEGRRWSDGLHQAVEAKEKVQIQEETSTYATITLQNFFRLYDKLAGMTGTAMTEANEFNAIYKLEAVAIPPNRKVQRNDLADLIYGSEQEKFDAILHEVQDLNAIGQPILVGTISVLVSERLSEQFTRKGIPHNLLNARHHQREAEIVLNAGQFAAVTIATNMAGRGTDIVLGKISAEKAIKHWQDHDLMPKRLRADSPELDEATVGMWVAKFLEPKEAEKLPKDIQARLNAVNKRRRADGLHALPLPSSFLGGLDVRMLGGLRILGTERHDSRRIDNQLRGRSGRQGDPGSSRFYLSLDDDLWKRFANPTMAGLMRSMGLKGGIPIESPMVSKQVERAQKKIEEIHAGIRKNLLEYDQVMNSQRRQIYQQRQRVLLGQDLENTLARIYHDALDDLVQRTAADGTRGPALATRLAAAFTEEVALPAPPAESLPVKEGGDACRAVLESLVTTALAQRKADFGPEVFPQVLRMVLLEPIDRRWKDHLDAMEHLRQTIGLEGIGGKDPRLRYKEEGYKRFMQMNELIRADIARMLFRLQVQPRETPVTATAAGNLLAGGFAPRSAAAAAAPAIAAAPALAMASAAASAGPDTAVETAPAKPKPGDPCPCGSGRPYIACHGG